MTVSSSGKNAGGRVVGGPVIHVGRVASQGSGGHGVLARTAAGSLPRDDGALDEQLPAPDAPRLLALESAGEALDPRGAEPAEGLGELDVLRSFGEPQLRVVVAARNGLAELLGLAPQIDQVAQLHRSHLRLRGTRGGAPLLTRVGPGPQACTGRAGLGPVARHPGSHLFP